MIADRAALAAEDLQAVRSRWRALGWHTDATIGDELSQAAAERPGCKVVFDAHRGRRIATVAELHRRSRSVAAGLQHVGLRPGDRLVIQMPNSVEMALTVQGALLAGLVFVPAIHIYGAAELDHILAETEANALAVPASWKNIDFMARVASLRRRPPVLVVAGEDGDGTGADGEGDGAIRWRSLEQAGDAPDDPRRSGDDLAAIVYTSGTDSGRLKGAAHTHNSLLVRARGRKPGDPRSPEGYTLLSPSPAGHIAGLLALLRGLVEPIGLILMDAWDAERALDLCLRYRPSHMNGAPYFYTSLFDAERRAGRANHWPTTFQTGGASVPPSLIRDAESSGRTGWRVYGSSEVPHLCSSGPGDSLAVRAGTDGLPGTDAEARILDDRGRETPRGEPGELVIRAPQAFSGYYRRADLDAESVLPGCWFRTGDLAQVDSEGHVTIVGRLKDLIIRGGENISAKEVEDILATHSAVLEAAAVPVPDELYGERLCAVLILRDGTELDLEGVRSLFEAAGVARQKAPEQLVFLGREWPRTASGKVRKQELLPMVRAELADRAPASSLRAASSHPQTEESR